MSIYQHYREYEHPFVDQVLSWEEQVEQTYRYQLTDFLDPREQQIIKSVIGSTNENIKYYFLGGDEASERKRAIIAPFYEPIEDDLFDIVLLEATFPEKFITLRHQDVMGTFLSLGLERKKLGDIIVTDGKFQLVTAKEIQQYVRQNLTRVKNSRVSLIEKPLSAMLKSNEDWEQSTQTVTSLRLDNLVAAIYRLSRNRAVEHIRRKYVKVNFKYIDDPAFELIEGDMMSVRRHGRSKLLSVNGQTRKNRWRISTAKLNT